MKNQKQNAGEPKVSAAATPQLSAEDIQQLQRHIEKLRKEVSMKYPLISPEIVANMDIIALEALVTEMRQISNTFFM